MKKTRHVNRFTTIHVLLDMITRRRLVLMDPDLWSDKNDTKLIDEYKRRKGISKVFAVCFSGGGETIHHWNAYSPGVAGCCIELDFDILTATLDALDEIRYGFVNYRKVHEIIPGSVGTENIPFTKRWPYFCEEEFRIIWEGTTSRWCHEIEIDLNMIRKVTVSQGMPDSVFHALSRHVRDALKRPSMKINHSTIYENSMWINKFRKA